MNLKPYYLLISTIALAGGIYMGWKDAQREMPSSPDPTDSGTGPALRKVPRAGVSSPVPEGDPYRPASPQGRESDGDGLSETLTSPSEGQSARPAEGRSSPTRAEVERLASIEALIEDGAFEAAAREAESLLDSSSTEARDAAEHLAAKARVLAHFVPPPAGDTGEQKAYRVRFASGADKLVAEYEEQGDRYRFQLESGVEWFPKREDVLEIQPAAVEDLKAAQWKRLQGRLRTMDDPIDIYLLVVKKCFQWGLRERGIEVLEYLIPRAGSEDIPRFFGGEDESEELVRQWRLAAGLSPVSGSDLAHTGEEGGGEEVQVTAVPASSGGEPGDGWPGAQEPEETEPAAPPSTVPAGGENDIIVEVSGLYGQALALYESTVGKDGQGKLLERAYNLLNRAQDMLGALPPSTAVSEWNRKVAMLKNDISKSSSFGL